MAPIGCAPFNISCFAGYRGLPGSPVSSWNLGSPGARVSKPPQRAAFKRQVSGVKLPLHEKLHQHAAFKRLHFHPSRLGDDYAVTDEVLGDGASGRVCLATHRLTGQRCAVKSLPVVNARDYEVEQRLTELEIFMSLDHPHIVRLLDVYICEERLDLVMECLEGGELMDRACEHELSEAEAARALRQALLALAYLHDRNIVHCDVKLENLLYEEAGGDHLKLCDFGYSQLCGPNTTMRRSVGTLSYSAPEVVGASHAYGSGCDLWSLGVVAYALLTSRLPFAGGKEVAGGQWNASPEVWAQRSQGALDFVSGLLLVNADSRMTAKAALEHPWIVEHRPASFGGCLDRSLFESLRSFAQSSALRRACLGTVAWCLLPRERSEVAGAFVAMDLDSSGTLELAELAAVLTSNFGAGDEEVKEIFGALSLNGTKGVGYSDFLASMCSSKIPLREAHVKEAFRCFDEGSGLITRESLQQLADRAPRSRVVKETLCGLQRGDALTEDGFSALVYGDNGNAR